MCWRLNLPSTKAEFKKVEMNLDEVEAITLGRFKELIDEGENRFIMALTQDATDKWHQTVFNDAAYYQYIATQDGIVQHPISRQSIQATIQFTVTKEGDRYISSIDKN